MQLEIKSLCFCNKYPCFSFQKVEKTEGIATSSKRELDLQLMSSCDSMCYTKSDHLVVSGKTKEQKREIHVYNRQGQCKKILPRPPEYENCKIDSMVEVNIAGKRYIVSCCFEIGQLTLHDLSSGDFSLAWKGGGNGDIKPSRICMGGPGELLVIDAQSYDDHNDRNVVVFDITSSKFTIKRAVDVMMTAGYLCYRNDPTHGGIIYTTDSACGYRLCATSMKTEGRLWYLGGIDESPESESQEGPILVAGKAWVPEGICADDEGRLYITDGHNRVVMVEATKGTALGTLRFNCLDNRKLLDPIWSDREKNLVIWNVKNTVPFDNPKATFFEIH